MNTTARSFKDFGIAPNIKAFNGDKIKIERILNRPITVLNFKIEPSKYSDKGSGKCLHLHISLDGTNHVVFSGSKVLTDMIQRVPPENFPFTATIVKNNEHLEFT